MVIKQLKAQVLENKKISRDFCKMRVASAYLAKNIKPGQFIEIRCSDTVEPLLRRPFSVHRILKNGIEILYEVVGKGTELLSKKKEGEPVDVIGPLGNGFDIKTALRPSSVAILIAGGIGVAPMLALAEGLVHSSQITACSKKGKPYVLIGGRTGSHILCEKEFKELGCDVKIATEDGSGGLKGLVTDLLKDLLLNTQYAIHYTLYACGPNAMLKAVAGMAKAREIPCQVSLEERMACGVGVCLGCPVKIRIAHSVERIASSGSFTRYAIRDTQYSYKMVCKDGPVFNTADIIW